MSVAAAKVIDVYRSHARDWIAARGDQMLERPWIDRFLALLPAGGRVLDLGCGPGIPIARHIATAGHAVTGVDSSPEMLETFRRNLPGSETILADMCLLEIPDRFDGILAWNSFFHLTQDDQRAMFGRFARLARPSAVLAFTSGPQAGEALGKIGAMICSMRVWDPKNTGLFSTKSASTSYITKLRMPNAAA